MQPLLQASPLSASATAAAAAAADFSLLQLQRTGPVRMQLVPRDSCGGGQSSAILVHFGGLQLHSTHSRLCITVAPADAGAAGAAGSSSSVVDSVSRCLPVAATARYFSALQEASSLEQVKPAFLLAHAPEGLASVTLTVMDERARLVRVQSLLQSSCSSSSSSEPPLLSTVWA